MIRRAIRVFLWTILASMGALGLALWLAIDATPAVQRVDTIDPQEIARAKRPFDANDPRWLRAGEAGRMQIPLTLLDTAAHHAARLGIRGQASVRIDDGRLMLTITKAIPATGGYLNIQAALRPGPGEPRLDSVAIGKLPLPAALGEALLDFAARQAGFAQEWRLARRSIGGIDFDTSGTNVTVDYVWRPEIIRQASTIAFPPEEVARLQRAQSALATRISAAPRGRPLPLRELLPGLLAVPDDDSPAQLRATLLVLAVYLAEKDLANLTPEARRWPRIPAANILLRERHDTAQHFTVSAALAAWAGEPVADAIGLWKEIDDIRHSGGFSFADLAADRAGTRFGQRLATDPEGLRRRLRAPLHDDDFIPRIDDLPEYLDEATFKQRFGSVDPKASPAYAAMQRTIETRLGQLPFYR
jgi:hypothetical protein